MAADSSGIELALARHVARLDGPALPRSVGVAFDRLISDFIAVVVAGYGDPDARKAALTFVALGGREDCSVIGSAVGHPAPAAAFAHGAFAHWFDWDDTHDSSHVHGGAVILPCIIALFEAQAKAGRSPQPTDFFAATVAAYDVACRLGGFLKNHSHRGWMPTGSGATIAAAAAGARILGLSEQEILSAMGIAAANAGLSRQALADRTNGKGILAGIAAKTAVDAVMLAQQGIVGAPHFVTGVYGLHALQAADRGNAADIVDGLGSRFSIGEVSIKPYPCCRSTHAVLDIVLSMRESDHSLVDRIKALDIIVPRGCYERCGAPFSPGDNPRLAAQFSLAYTAAVALHSGAPSLADFATANVLRNERELGRLISAISTTADDSVEGDLMTPATVRVTSDGWVTERTTTVVKGAPDVKLSEDDEMSKLKRAAANLTVEQRNHIRTLGHSVRKLGPEPLMAALKLLRHEN